MGETMLQDMEQLPIDELSSPLIAQILEFQESELFSETLHDSEASCCTTTNTNNIGHNNTNYSLLFESTQDNENDLSVSIDFNNNDNNNNTTIDNYTLSNYLDDYQQNHFDYSTNLSNNPNLVTDNHVSLSHYHPNNDLPILAPALIGGGLDLPSQVGNNEEECLSGMNSYTRMMATSTTDSSSMFDPTIGPYMPDTTLDNNPGMLSSGGGGYFFLGMDLLPQELDFLGDNGGILGSHTLQNYYNFTSELQPMSNESQQIVNGVANSTNSLTPEISGLEDPSFKVGKLTAEERREKIHRYMKKRNERNFSKKLKYACRKTLADSRPRVRGRFAKNDELEMHRNIGSINHHEEDIDEDVIVKDEDDMIDSSDILAHISGVNSFKCSNSLQSWI